jgi:hypothetical protein
MPSSFPSLASYEAQHVKKLSVDVSQAPDVPRVLGLFAICESVNLAFEAINQRIELFNSCVQFSTRQLCHLAFPSPDRTHRPADHQTMAENADRRKRKMRTKSSKGVDLVPGSVSSLLSRLKNDDVLFFDGSRYRLKRYAGPKHAA